jgi:outer membrane biosynthesis protein TonB
MKDNVMQNTGQGSDKKSYRVLLLLLVGLASFSSAMKELNQVRELTLQTTNFLAQLKDAFAPAGELTTVSVETCQNSRMSPPPPPLPALPPVPPAPAVESDAMDIDVPEVAPAPPAPPVTPPAAPKPREVPQPRRLRPAHDPAEVRVFFSTDDFEKSIKDAFESDQSLKALKAKNRRYIYVTPDDHDVILKTFNRSINLRGAS